MNLATLNVKNFPDSLYGELKALAEKEHRSVSQEVIHLLSRAVGTAGPLSLLELKGLGKELWEGIDASDYVAEERDSWD